MIMRLGQNGHATIELMLLMPLILLLLTIIWISGEFFYLKHRALLASKCLALHERRGGTQDLGKYFFPSADAGKRVFNVVVGSADPATELDAGNSGDFDKGGWDFMIRILDKLRGPKHANVTLNHKSALVLPDRYQTVTATTFIAASEWRYKDLRGGYTGILRSLVGDALGKIGDYFD